MGNVYTTYTHKMSCAFQTFVVLLWQSAVMRECFQWKQVGTMKSQVLVCEKPVFPTTQELALLLQQCGPLSTNSVRLVFPEEVRVVEPVKQILQTAGFVEHGPFVHDVPQGGGPQGARRASTASASSTAIGQVWEKK